MIESAFTMEKTPILQTRELSVYAGSRTILHKTDLTVMPHSVLGILGPSGAGKSTLIKCLNRLIELTPTLRVTGDILFKGESIFASHMDVDALRSRIGMIFQQPVVFPNISAIMLSTVIPLAIQWPAGRCVVVM